MEHSNCQTNVEELLPLPAFEHDPECVDECSSFGASHRGTDLLSWAQTHVRCGEWTGFASNALSAADEHPHTKFGDGRKNMFFNILKNMLFRLNWAVRRLNWAVRHLDGKNRALRDHPCTASSEPRLS